jgi:tol-pal system protein YbgF
VAGAAGGAEVHAGDEQTAYARAFDMLKGGDYAQAQAAFRDFLRDHPDGSLADNAQYWIGEAYYVTRDYDHASEAFERVGEHWPDSRKAPDALLKLGYTQFEQKRYAAARGTLQRVVDRYAGTEAARLAAERLAKFPAEAH